MPLKIQSVSFFIFSVLVMFNLACQRGPSGSQQKTGDFRKIIGKWNLVTYTDTRDDLTLKAGIKTDIGEGVMRNINIKVHLMKDDRYQMITRVISSSPGFRQDVFDDTSRGFYELRGDTLLTTDDRTEKTESSFLSIDGDRLTLKYSMAHMVLKRQSPSIR